MILLPEILKFLGRMFHHRGDNVLIKALPGYFDDLLSMFGMLNCKGSNTPGTSTVKDVIGGDQPLSKADHQLFRTAVGKLL